MPFLSAFCGVLDSSVFIIVPYYLFALIVR